MTGEPRHFSTPSMEGCTPLLRWAGSKRQVIERLALHVGDEHGRYVEAFAGSCSLFFRLAPTAALLADKNRDLIETYEVLRDEPELLHAAVSSIAPNRESYYRIRSLNPKNLKPLQRAARFMFLNRFCFNGIYRTNNKGQFNVPYSPRKTGGVPSPDHFRRCAKLLSRATLRAWDFGTTLRYVKKGDFVYLDPPYALHARRVFREYGPRPFGESDLERLFRHLVALDQRGVTFLLSYVDSRPIRRLASDWSIRRVVVRRNIAGFVKARRRAYEVLITNGTEGA